MWLLHAPTAEHLAEHSIQKIQPGEKECKGATSTHQLPQSSELMLRRWLTISSAYPRLKRELTTLICPFLNAAVVGLGTESEVRRRRKKEEEKTLSQGTQRERTGCCSTAVRAATLQLCGGDLVGCAGELHTRRGNTTFVTASSEKKPNTKRKSSAYLGSCLRQHSSSLPSLVRPRPEGGGGRIETWLEEGWGGGGNGEGGEE